MKRRTFLAAAPAALLSACWQEPSGPSTSTVPGPGANPAAAPVASPVEVKFLTLENPVARNDILEHFSYMCPHCAELEPLLQAWVSSPAFPAGARLERNPVSFNPDYERAARLFHGLALAGSFNEKIHAAVFRAIHRDGLSLRDPAGIISALNAAGADGPKILLAMDSPESLRMARESHALAKSMRVSSVPLLVVAGRFVVSSRTSPSNGKMISDAGWIYSNQAAAAGAKVP